MKYGVLGFVCYGLVTTINASLIRAATAFACLIFMAGAWNGRAQPVTLQTGYNFVGCQVNEIGGNNVNNTSFLQVPSSLSDPNGVQNAALNVWNCSTFSTYQYFSAADAAPTPAGCYDGGCNRMKLE